MSKSSAQSAATVRKRIEQARQESRWKDAIDLARNLASSDPQEENRTLLRQIALGYARAVAARGRSRDLASEVPKLHKLFPNDPAWAADLAEIAIGAGLLAEGLKLLPPGSDLAAMDGVVARLADCAVQQGSRGRESVPENLHEDHARVLRAFALVEQGKDEEVRTELQGIGLRSPFSEWRLFLRGLLAFHAGDDARAIEAWSRLKGDRLPFRLSAPLRLGIDPAFRDAQSPETRLGLVKQARKLSPTRRLAGAIEALEKGIQEQRSLHREFTALEPLKAELAALPADLRDRISRSIYWSLLPAPAEEHARYLRVFTSPREDPHLKRLAAIARERAGSPYEAQTVWLEYEKEVASNRSLWGEDTERVRALLWLHAGTLGSISPEDLEGADASPFDILGLGGRKAKPTRPKATPEACFEKARQLGPDLAEAYIAPIQYLRSLDKSGEARPLADELRQKFPDSIDAQMTAAQVYADLEDIPEAMACAQVALRINPLDERVKNIRNRYAMSLVLYHLASGQLAQAREAVSSARELLQVPEELEAIRLLDATISWKAGDAGPIRQYRQEKSGTTPPLLILYSIVVQANVANIDRKARAEFDKEFKAGLDGELQPETAIPLGRAIAAQAELSQSPYRGYKTHRDKVVKQLTKLATDPKLSPKYYLRLGQVLSLLKAKRPISQLANNLQGGTPQPIRHYLRFLCDLQAGRGTFFGGPPVHWLGFIQSALHTIKSPEDRKFLEDELERFKEEFDLEDFRTPFERMFGGGDDPTDDDEGCP